MPEIRDLEEKSPEKETIVVPLESTESGQFRAQTEASHFKVVTPKYKTGDKISSEINIGGSHEAGPGLLKDSDGQYQSEHIQETFKMHVIDPKVQSNAYIPAHGTSTTVVKARAITEQFPSHHNKRSLLNLDPIEQRKFRSVETRPITTNAYLSESLNRHRSTEESNLQQYLKANEKDANQPWNKPKWPEGSVGRRNSY